MCLSSGASASNHSVSSSSGIVSSECCHTSENAMYIATSTAAYHTGAESRQKRATSLSHSVTVDGLNTSKIGAANLKPSYSDQAIGSKDLIA